MSLHYRIGLIGGWQPVPYHFTYTYISGFKSIKRSNDRVLAQIWNYDILTELVLKFIYFGNIWKECLFDLVIQNAKAWEEGEYIVI